MNATCSERCRLRLHCWSHVVCGVASVLMVWPFLSGSAQTAHPVARTREGILDANSTSKSLIGIQYEQWFYGPASWKTAEAIPLLGRYATDEAIVSKHYDEFHRLGIDWLLIDWSNMLWTKPAWEQHTGETKRLEDKTSILFQTALHLQQQGKYAPKLVFMVGLQNGPPVPDGVQRLNGILAWLKKNYLDRPEYRDLWLYDGGKPLLTILYWPPDPCAQLSKDLAHTPLNASNWTIRWMATQLQENHAERCGMWSWMDGSIPQTVTRHNGKAEEIVVTPSSFQLPGRGWTAPSAIARDHGLPYLESWKAAFKSRPKFIQIHQWNEFAGQENGHGLPSNYWGESSNSALAQSQHSDVYADEYNVQLSDDIEPTDSHACSYRGCGGWGYYYFNLTRAIISLYRGETPDITVLSLSGPAAPLSSTTRFIDLHWAFLGKAPSSYSLSVDGQLVRHVLHGSAYRLDAAHMQPGKHKVKLTANGVYTYFSLDPEQATFRSQQPLPVESEITIESGSRSVKP